MCNMKRGAYHLTEESGWGVESIMVSDWPVYCRIATSVTVWIQKRGGRVIWVAWVWNRKGTEKLVNGTQNSVWFVPTVMNGLPQIVLLNFRFEFPKSDLTIYLLSGISEIFGQMVISTQGIHKYGQSMTIIWSGGSISRKRNMKEKPEYSSLVTACARECITCYGRDGTTASRSIDTEGESAALILTRKQ